MTPTAWTPEHVAAFGPSVDASPWGAESAGDVLGGSWLYEMSNSGRRALVAARPAPLRTGRRLDIVGLVSLGERLRIEEFDAGMGPVAAAHGASMLAMCTKWPHVVRACARNGWVQTGTILVKKL